MPAATQKLPMYATFRNTIRVLEERGRAVRASVDRSATFSILVFLLSVLLLCSPLTAWWMGPALPWFTVYIIWLALIMLTAWLVARRRH